MSESPTPRQSARLIAPRTALASCVRAYLTRSTLGVTLPVAQRFNHFPASAFCSFSWFMVGESHYIDPATPDPAILLPQAVFAGPHSHPSVSYNPGPVHAMMVLFYPHALHQLTGLDMANYHDQLLPLGEVLGPDWQALSQTVLNAPDDDARIAAIESFLLPRWQATGERGNPVQDWVRRLTVQAAAVGWGRGVRNLERRIKAWAGQPLRTLRRLRRAEQSFLDARHDVQSGTVSWAEVAQRAGYADQAHFCRETRQITGLSPTQLARVMQEDERYWLYRIWS